jgi:hypothetical protein
MANAVGGRLGTLAQGMVYCRTLSACLDTFDYRRAIEWTDTIDQRAPDLGTVGFPGDCRTHKAALCVVRGDWQRGAAEAEAAATESRAYDFGHTAQALTALGEIRLRQGDLDASRTAFDRADAFGLPPGPGPDALTRARYLPAAVAIAVAVGDLGEAEARTAELGSIGDRFGGPALAAASLDARGAVALAGHDVHLAIAHLRGAAREWRTAGAPYETARSRLRTAQALDELGDSSGVVREARAALAAFEALGARLDIVSAMRLAASEDAS